MTVTLELKPEIEARVAEQAAAHGLTVEAYIQSVLESLIAEPPATAQERLQLVEEWLKTRSPITAPPAFTPRIIGTAPPPKDRSREAAWLAQHRDEYAGQWVALDGDRLLGHGPHFKEVIEAAQRAGVKDALVFRVEPGDALPYVGI